MKKHVVVLGAGVQGCTIALEIANRGFSVELIDKDSKPFNRSSTRNEGKIHLGLVYMNDSTFATPKIMLKASLRFYNYLEKWIGKNVKDLNISTPFYYLVSNESLLNPDQLQKGYNKLQLLYERERSEYPELNYLGHSPRKLTRRVTNQELSKHFDTKTLQGGFHTAELAIDTTKLGHHLRRAVFKHSNITFTPGHSVRSVSQINNSFTVEGDSDNGPWCKQTPQVINALWGGKYLIDKTMGIPIPENILHRLKYRLIAKLPGGMINYPSATMVVGRFGDVVIRPDSTAYVSWYPEACLGWSNDIAPPKSWEGPCKGIVDPKDADRLAKLFLNHTEPWYPEIKNITPILVDAGNIVAVGNTDVDQKKSQLHKRSKIGVTSYGGYHSVETGKLTTAPMYALDTADAVEAFFNQQ